MKIHTPKPLQLGFLIASVMATLPVVTLAQPPVADPSAPAVVKPDNKATKNLSGKVTAKSDTSLTIDGRTVTLTSATTCSKGGASLGSRDIKVGDMVNVVTSDDGQVAVSVEVTTSS